MHRNAPDAHLVFEFSDRKSGRAFFNQKCCDATAALFRICIGKDAVDLSRSAVGGPFLVAIDDEGVAITNGSGFQASGVAA